MTQETRLPLEEAERVANELVPTLRDVCFRIEVVGSVRRLKAPVKDTEVPSLAIANGRPWWPRARLLTMATESEKASSS